MTNEFSFGHLYHPTPNGGIFRDIYLSNNEDLYCRDFPTSGIESLLFGTSFQPIDISQLLGVLGNAADLITIFGSARTLVKVVTGSKLWRKFTQPFKNPNDSRKLWPKTLATAQGNLWDLLDNNHIALRSDEAVRQNKRILANASEELKIFRTAFSDDLVILNDMLDKIKRGCQLEFNIASPKSLLAACHNELGELEKNSTLFENMRVEFDFQAKSKYLRDPRANFARAASDSLCVIRSIQNYIQYNSTLEDRNRFTLNLYSGEPSFRGTITENEFSYVSTPPWAPGMIGDLHAQVRDQDNKRTWERAKKEFLKEINLSMKPQERDYYTASEELRSSAIDAIYQAERRSDKTRDDISELEKMIKEIDNFKPEFKSDSNNTLERIRAYRVKLRDKFGELFPRLDESIISA
jgi:hypothetical protein